LNWQEVIVTTDVLFKDVVADALRICDDCRGVSIEQPFSIEAQKTIENAPVKIRAYFPEGALALNCVVKQLELQEETLKGQWQVSLQVVKDEDWEESWKKYFHPLRIGKKIVIKPTWENFIPGPDDVLIELDPGMAFGTGDHATTRMCLELLEEYIKDAKTVIDAGCGSGILSLAAARLGARKVLAFDNDEVAAKIAAENVQLNKLDEMITVETGDIIKILPNLNGDIVMANIIAEVIEQLITGASKALYPGGYLLVSGIIGSKWPGIQRSLLETGFVIDRVAREGEWVAAAACRT
jgi:ribosomal protein L11 methyltransferase